jgi:hypothetical protein
MLLYKDSNYVAPSTTSRAAVLAALILYRACRLANDIVQRKQRGGACQGISLVRTCYTAGYVVRFQISQYSRWYSRKGTSVWYLPWQLACLNLLHSRLCCALAEQPVFTMIQYKGINCVVPATASRPDAPVVLQWLFPHPVKIRHIGTWKKM